MFGPWYQCLLCHGKKFPSNSKIFLMTSLCQHFSRESRKHWEFITRTAWLQICFFFRVLNIRIILYAYIFKCYMLLFSNRLLVVWSAHKTAGKWQCQLICWQICCLNINGTLNKCWLLTDRDPSECLPPKSWEFPHTENVLHTAVWEG